MTQEFTYTDATAVVTPGTARSPADMVALMKAQFGGTMTGDANRTGLITNGVRFARDYVWDYTAWDFRHVVLTLTTTPGQAYTELPSDYARVARWGDWLVGPDSSHGRPQYVEPDEFEVVTARTKWNSLNADSPRYFTIGNEGTARVVRWPIAPTAVIAYGGFHYFKASPAWSATSTTPVFDDCKWDLLWIEAASAWLMAKLKPVEQGVRSTFPNSALVALMEDSRRKYEWHPPSSVERDEIGDLSRLRYGMDGRCAADYDADGNLLVAGDWDG